MTKIIQCPSCNTKFAIQETQLAGSKNPKFQCSRCQTVFSLLEEPLKEEQKSDINTTSTTSEKTFENTELTNPKINTEVSSDISKVWSFGTKVSAEQLDLGFSSNDIKINKGEDKDKSSEFISQENEKIESENESEILKQKPKLDKETIENIVYASSGSESPVSVDWDSITDDTTFSKNIVEANILKAQKNSENISRSNKILPTEEPQKIIIEEKNNPIQDETLVTPLEGTNIDRKSTGDLSSLFRPGRQRASTNTFQLPSSDSSISEEKIEENKSSSLEKENFKEKSIEIAEDPEINSWSMLKNVITGGELSTLDNIAPSLEKGKTVGPNSKINDLDELPLHEIKGAKEDSSEDTSNRSMKNTTVIKRDSLEVEGFLKPEEEETIFSENFSEIAISKKSNKQASKAVKGINYENYFSSNFFRAIMISWSIPLCLLLFFFFYSKKLESPKNNFSGFELSIFSPMSDILPPVGLSLSSLRAELRPDKDKNPIVVITGFIFNTTEKSLYDAVIETQLFDNLNRTIKSNKIKVPNELNKLRSTLEVINSSTVDHDRMQEIRTARDISPNTTVPFKAIIGDIGKGYFYFGARVYSVKRDPPDDLT